MSTPKEQPSGPPLRALAMVLIALAILFLGLGAASLGGGSEESASAESPAPTSAAAPTVTTTRAPAAPAPSASASTAPAASSVPSTASSAPASASASASATSSSGVDLSSVSVRVLNNSTVSGLAAGTADELAAAGWNVAETGNYSEGAVSTTTVFYGSSATEKAAAQKIAAELGVSAEPRFAGIANASPGVIVIVTSN